MNNDKTRCNYCQVLDEEVGIQTSRQKHLHRIVEASAGIYNHCVALHKRYYKIFGKSLNMYKLQKHPTKLKKLPRYAYWKIVPSQAIQDITERIDESYKKFFDYVKKRKGLKCSRPKFKKRINYKSYTLKQVGSVLSATQCTTETSMPPIIY